MANQSLLRSSISIKKIQKSANTLTKNMAATRTVAVKINKSIVKSTAFRRKALSEDQKIFKKRRDAAQLRQKEDIIEASSGLAGAVKRTGKVIASSTKGFFGRILDYFGTLLVGWLINNLPKILKMAQTLIERVQNLFKVLSNFRDGLINTLKGFGDLLRGVIVNITKFDFTDQSGRVQKAMEDIGRGTRDMESNLDQMLRIFKDPMSYFFGDDVNLDEFDDTSGYGTPEQQALLKTIRFAEGTAGPQGYSTFFGGSQYGGDLTELTVAEVEELVTKFLAEGRGKFTDSTGKEDQSAAVGAYQFIDITGLAKSVKMSTNRKFDEAFQDELALRLAARNGVSPEILKKEGLSDNVIKRLSPTWASFPGNDYNQPTKRKGDLKNVFQKNLSATRKATISPIKPGKRTIVRDEINVAGPSGGTPRVGLTPGQGFGASRDGGKRLHEGIDIGTSNQTGYYVGARIDGRVSFAGTSGGYGKLVIIKDSGGTQYWFAHLAKIYVRSGEEYRFGTTIGEIGKTGGNYDIHLHYEVRPGGKAIDPKPYLNLLSIGKTLIESDISKDGQVVSKAQVSSITAETNRVASNITAERKGKTTIVLAGGGGQQSEAPKQEPMVASADPSRPTINTKNNVMAELNRTNLLVELAYT